MGVYRRRLRERSSRWRGDKKVIGGVGVALEAFQIGADFGCGLEAELAVFFKGLLDDFSSSSVYPN